MTGKKYEEPFHLDVSFEEAMERYAQTDPAEVTDQKKRKGKRKRSRPAKSPFNPTPKQQTENS
jgi:hypothetical protein